MSHQLQHTRMSDNKVKCAIHETHTLFGKITEMM